MDIIKALAEELNIGRHQAEAAVKLIDERQYHSVHCQIP